MPDYSKGKIYTIRCRTDDSLIYVGSTVEERLSARFAGHKRNKNISLYKYIINNCNGDWDDWYIELYELCPCNSKMELEKREGEIQREISTINNRIEGRTYKEYCNDNKDKIRERKREYYENHIDDKKEYDKIYHQQNKEKEYQQQHKRYFENKDIFLEKRKEKVICECGCEMTKQSLSSHRKTKKHIDLMSSR